MTPSNAPGPVVLLLDDHSLVRDGFKLLLRMAEPTASFLDASTFEQAVALSDSSAIDVAFLDHDLKGEKTGLDVLKHMRQSDQPTRIVMLSGSDDPSLVMACLAAGASGFIRKDMPAEGLFRKALDAIMDGQVFLPASVIGGGGFSPRPNAPQSSSDPASIGLTPRQAEVLYYLAQGLPDKAIARQLGIAESTIRQDHNPPIFRALGISRRTQVPIEVARRRLQLTKPQPR